MFLPQNTNRSPYTLSFNLWGIVQFVMSANTQLPTVLLSTTRPCVRFSCYSPHTPNKKTISASYKKHPTSFYTSGAFGFNYQKTRYHHGINLCFIPFCGYFSSKTARFAIFTVLPRYFSMRESEPTVDSALKRTYLASVGAMAMMFSEPSVCAFARFARE